MESKESPILQGLNPAQRAAVVNYDAPSLIIAGAGSGKTRVLTSRIAYMIEQGVAPFNILALTFTNKAAEQMRERIAQMIPDNRSRYIRMGTFHSVFSRILRENADCIGFPDSFTIYEPSDCKNLLKTIVRELNLPDEKYKPNLLASRISYAKNCLVTPGAYLANSVYAAEDRQAQIPEFGNIYNIYCQRCKRNGAMDFDDLLLQTNILLRDAPDVLARYQEQFKYILVDEYQDTNYAQYVIIRRLSQLHSKVCVVGDDAQSIYSFRGAKIENILSFQKDFPDAMVFKLEQNYRSTRTIVDAANSVIVRNSKRMEKHCFSEGDKGEPIRIWKAYDEHQEAEKVAADIRSVVSRTNCDLSDIVILYRTNNQSRALENQLRAFSIPYRVYKGSSFYDHKVIKDLLAYIRLVINPHDDEAFRRIVNYPTRGIGDTTVDRISQLAADKGVSMWETVDALVTEPATDPIERTIARKVTEFVSIIRTLSLSRSSKGVFDFGQEVIAKSGVVAAYCAENMLDISSMWDDKENPVVELLKSMQEFEDRCKQEINEGTRDSEEIATIEEWLQSMMLMTDADKKDDPENNNRVTLMTIHSSKGLEYDYVYLVGVEEGLFPSMRTIESLDGLEEERRLFYVAITRAKISVSVSCTEMRLNFRTRERELARPSRFLQELDPRYVETNFDLRSPRCPQDGEGPSAIDELRRRFDYRFQQKRQADRAGGNNGGQQGGFGGRGSGGSFGGRSADGQSGPARRFARAAAPQGARPAGRPDPALVQTPRPSTDGMRRVGVRQAVDGGVPVGTSMLVSGDYTVGQRVEHPKFGVGIVQRIETLATDHKLVVAFDSVGEKTLLAKFAKLTKL